MCRLVLIALVLVTMGRLTTAEFLIWDDPHTVAQNPHLNPPSLAAVAGYWRDWRGGAAGLYVPLTYTVWSALAAVARVVTSDGATAPNPWVFHCANLAIHILAVLAAFEVLRRLVGSSLGACAGAAVFAVHPVQVETVAWVSGMKDLLAGMFSMVAIWQYIVAARQRAPLRRRLSYILSIVALALALLSKPSAVMVGPICLTLDILLLRRPARVAILWCVPMFLLASPAIAVGRMVQGLPPIAAPPIWARPLIACDALTFYLGKLIWPLHLGIDYGRRPDVVMASWLFRIAWVVPAGVAGLLVWARSRLAWAAALVFLLAVLPVLGFTPFLYQQFSTVADHYLYLAMLGPALLVAGVLAYWTRRAGFVAAGVVVALWAGVSFVQAGYWRNDFVLFPHALAVNPNSAALHNNFGSAFFDAGRYADAERELRRAVELQPENPEARRNLAQTEVALGQTDQAERDLRRFLAEGETDPLVRAQDLFRLGSLLLDTGRPSSALPYLEQAERIKPDPRVRKLIDRARRAATMPAPPTTTRMK